MQPRPPVSADLGAPLDEIAATLAALPLPSGALPALAEAAGAPVQVDASPRQIVEVAARLQGALPALLTLAATAAPERASTLLALRDGASGPPTGARRSVLLISGLLGRAWWLHLRPLAWRWAQAERALTRARALLPSLEGDLDQPRLARWADEVAGALSTLPERRARIGGAGLIRRLDGSPALAGALYTVAQLVGDLPRLWPAGLLAAAAWLFWLAPAGGDGGPGLSSLGQVHGASASDPSPRLAPRAVSLPRPPQPSPAAQPAASRPRRARPQPDPTVAPEPAPQPELVDPAPSDPLVEPDQAQDLTMVEQAVEAPPAAPGGGVSGGGTIRHTALPKEAPMVFLGVSGLPVSAEEPRPGELWVAQTEVTEDQWMALMGLDFAVVTGRAERPAEHMTWCEALEFANRLSTSERLEPVYDIPRGCDRGARANWRPGADGYRLPTEAEWESMVGVAPGWGVDARALVRSRAPDALGLYGVGGNAAEFVWAARGEPVLRHRSCAVEVREPTALWPEGAPLPCRSLPMPNERVIGGGLRLVRGAPPPQG